MGDFWREYEYESAHQDSVRSSYSNGFDFVDLVSFLFLLYLAYLGLKQKS